MHNFEAFHQNAQTSLAEAEAAMELNNQAFSLNTEGKRLAAAFETPERVERRIADLYAAGASDDAPATGHASKSAWEHGDSEEAPRRCRSSDEIREMMRRIRHEAME